MWTWIWNIRKCFGGNREGTPLPEGEDDADSCRAEGSLRVEHSGTSEGRSWIACSRTSPAIGATHPESNDISVSAEPEIFQHCKVPELSTGEVVRTPQLDSPTLHPAVLPSYQSKSSGLVADIVQTNSWAGKELAKLRKPDTQTISPVKTNINPKNSSYRGSNEEISGFSGKPSLSISGTASQKIRTTGQKGTLTLNAQANSSSFAPECHLDISLEPPDAALQIRRAQLMLKVDKSDRLQAVKEGTSPNAFEECLMPFLEAKSASCSPQRPGKENAANMTTEKLHRAWTESARKPQVQVKVLGNECCEVTGSYCPQELLTPSPTQVPRFVMTTDSTYGSPNVVGVENLLTRYKEDKHLRVHDTPFEIRVEQFIESERAFKESQSSICQTIQ